MAKFIVISVESESPDRDVGREDGLHDNDVVLGAIKLDGPLKAGASGPETSSVPTAAGGGHGGALGHPATACHRPRPL